MSTTNAAKAAGGSPAVQVDGLRQRLIALGLSHAAEALAEELSEAVQALEKEAAERKKTTKKPAESRPKTTQTRAKK